MRKFALPSLVVCLLALAAPALSQEHYTDGPVWRVNYFNVKPGKMGDALKDLRENFSKISAAAKAQGIIQDFKVYLNVTSDGPDDWDIATATLYKSWANLDGLTAKVDPITLKHYGSAEARTKANADRLELWSLASSNLAREITMK